MEKEFGARLALGTVQFGLAYGVSNRNGQVSFERATAIVAWALDHGVGTFDTAAAYGNSEEVLGRILAADARPAQVISKFPSTAAADTLAAELAESLRRLRRGRLRAYLSHSPLALLDRGVGDALERARADGLIERFGTSAYRPAEVHEMLDRGVAFDFVQLPYNVLDQRFLALLPELRARGVEVHVRSAFLQGLLFLPEAQLAAQFDPVRGRLREVRRLADAAGVPLGALLLNFAALQEVDKVVIGVTTVAELEQNLGAAPHLEAVRALLPALTELAYDDEAILLPMNWKL